MDKDVKTDILIIGAGTAGLAAAYRLKQNFKHAGINKSIMVIDKSKGAGAHTLSGACFDSGSLDTLIPDWRQMEHPFVKTMLKREVKRDSLAILGKKSCLPISTAFVPSNLRHKGDFIISTSELVKWLIDLCESAGIEVYHEVTAAEILLENGKITGCLIAEQGLAKNGEKRSCYAAAYKINAEIVLIADGSLGLVSRDLIEKFNLANKKQSMIYSIGVKQLIRLPDHSFGANRVVHTLGYPIPLDVFGGGFIYGLEEDLVAIGLIISLTWRYQDYNAQEELERLKMHPTVRKWLAGGEVIYAGAKNIPEGGYYALPKPGYDNALLLGDAAGLVNMSRFKGLHLSIASGLAAADAVSAYLAAASHDSLLSFYEAALAKQGILREMFKSRNFRQVFEQPAGYLLGAPLSLIQGFIPFELTVKSDREATMPVSIKQKRKTGVVENFRLKREDFVYLARVRYKENTMPHISINQPDLCRTCQEKLGAPCLHFCPSKVYEWDESAQKIQLAAANCLQDCTCTVKCPYDNITWKNPDSGEGPFYQNM